MNLGAGERMAEKIRRAQLEGSRYADRPPIGKPEVIERVPREALTRFYRDWYRPNLMAVIVTGDVDRDAVVGMIKSHFSALTNPSPARPRPGVRRPGEARHALRDRHRQGNDRDAGRVQQPAAGAQPGVGRRLSRDHAGPVVRRDAHRPARRADPAREPAVYPRRGGSQPVPDAADQGRGQPPGAGVERRRRARPRRARHRAAARRARSASPRPSSRARSRTGWRATSAS